jgi:hypothetical protein
MGCARKYFLVIIYQHSSTVFLQPIRRINVFSNSEFTTHLLDSSDNKINLKDSCTNILKDTISTVRNYVDVIEHY